MAEPLLEIRDVKKNYGGLRPLRVGALAVAPGERVAITGVDAAVAEILVNVITGAALPDEGEVRLFGRATAAITDAGDWLATLDRIGMVSPRAILAENLSVEQGIAMAFTLSLDPIPPQIAARASGLAREAGLGGTDLHTSLAAATPLVKARCRLARALATSPALLVLEHANALVPDLAEAWGREIAAIAKARGMAVLALTADETFATAVADRVLALEAATGRLRARRNWRRWFGSPGA